MHAAQACIGVKETYANRGTLVDLFETSVGGVLGQSWCMDFLQAMIAYVEVTLHIQSPFPATRACTAAWNLGKKAALNPLTPLPGDVIIWQHGETWQGHCGIILAQDSLTYTTVEGNTNDDGSREGDGVYLKKRAKGGSQTLREVGFLRVFQ